MCIRDRDNAIVKRLTLATTVIVICCKRHLSAALQNDDDKASSKISDLIMLLVALKLPVHSTCTECIHVILLTGLSDWVRQTLLLFYIVSILKLILM